MNFRAVIFDIYNTLLEVGPPPVDAEARWDDLWRDRFKTQPRLSLTAFPAEPPQIIVREHSAPRARTCSSCSLRDCVRAASCLERRSLSATGSTTTLNRPKSRVSKLGV